MKIIILLVLSYNIIFAQILNIDLNSAIEIALKNNKQHKISKLALGIAKAQYEQASSFNYPMVDINIMAIREKEDRIFSMKSQIDMSAFSILGLTSLPLDIDVTAMGRDTIYSSLDILYPIYTGGKVSSIIKQAEINKLIAKTSIIREKQNVIFDIKKYYYAFVLSSQLENLAALTLDRMQFISSITKNFYENGESLNVKKTDYLNVQLVVSLINSTLSKIQAKKEMLKLALINTMGIPWNSNIKILVNNKELKEEKYQIETLIEEAYKSNTNIKEIQLAIKITKAQINEAKAGYYPDVALTGSLSNIYNSYEFGILNEEQANSWNIGLVAKIPLFNGSRTASEVKEKTINKNKIILLSEILKEATALQIQSEFIKVKSSYKQIRRLKDAKIIAQEHRILNTRGYQIDLITPEKVIESQYMEAYIKADYFKYVHDYKLSLAKIDKLVGRELK